MNLLEKQESQLDGEETLLVPSALHALSLYWLSCFPFIYISFMKHLLTFFDELDASVDFCVEISYIEIMVHSFSHHAALNCLHQVEHISFFRTGLDRK